MFQLALSGEPTPKSNNSRQLRAQRLDFAVRSAACVVQHGVTVETSEATRCSVVLSSRGKEAPTKHLCFRRSVMETGQLARRNLFALRDSKSPPGRPPRSDKNTQEPAAATLPTKLF